MLAFSIQHLIAMTILTLYHKVRNQIDTVKMSRTKLIHSLKVKAQICNLPYFKSDKMQCWNTFAGSDTIVHCSGANLAFEVVITAANFYQPKK